MLKPLGYSPSLYLGLNVSAENLLKAMVIQSINDAAEVLTFFVGKQKFLKLMTKKAQELDMENTVFYDVHGLNPKNTSTASDLARLLAYVYKKRSEILSTTKENNFWLPDKTGTMLKFRNMNNFYPLSNFVGGKTGYLPQTKQTFAGIFKIKNQPIAVVVLHSANRQADVFVILKRLSN